jgi:hypothetical protein
LTSMGGEAIVVVLWRLDPPAKADS